MDIHEENENGEEDVFQSFIDGMKPEELERPEQEAPPELAAYVSQVEEKIGAVLLSLNELENFLTLGPCGCFLKVGFKTSEVFLSTLAISRDINYLRITHLGGEDE